MSYNPQQPAQRTQVPKHLLVIFVHSSNQRNTVKQIDSKSIQDHSKGRQCAWRQEEWFLQQEEPMTLCNSRFTFHIICIQKAQGHRYMSEQWSILRKHIILYLFENYTYHHSQFYLLFLPSISYTKHAKNILSLAH